jgi:Glycosyl transferase family 2
MKSLTLVTITGRPEHQWRWMTDSLMRQLTSDCDGKITLRLILSDGKAYPGIGNCCGPKPSLWQGPHRVTAEDWWAASNARNTGICLADTEWIVFLDDRTVLAPTWLQAVKDAMEGNYIMLGAYEKRRDMLVEDGRIVEPGTRLSLDNRWQHMEAQQLPNPFPCDGGWFYGCCIAMPLAWALDVGGFEEAMDGMGFEDQITGMMYHNAGYPMKYDMRAFCIQDRTPGQTGKVYRREDKGISPNDKSHRALEIFGKAKNTSNRHRLLQSRAAVQRGEPFPVLLGPREDWWDGEKIDPNYMRKGE